MTEQVYYSIDEYPEICAKAIADAIRADSLFERSKWEMADNLKQAARTMGARLGHAFDSLAYSMFAGGDL